MNGPYVLDACSLIAFLNAEEGAEKVKGKFKATRAVFCRCDLSEELSNFLILRMQGFDNYTAMPYY